MAQNSYFGRMVHGGGVPPLTPPRPVANLWKWARIERGESDAVPEASERSPRVRPQSAVSERLATPAQRVSLQPLLPVRKERRANTGPDAAAAISVYPSAASVAASAKNITVGVDARKTDDDIDPQNRRVTDVKMAAPTQRRSNSSSPVVRTEADPMRARRPKPEDGMQPTVRIEAANDSSAKPASQPARSLNQLEPSRRREVPRPEWSAPTQARTEQKNTIQIGRIEVQVVSPPVQRAAAPAPPLARLARGYTLWSTW